MGRHAPPPITYNPTLFQGQDEDTGRGIAWGGIGHAWEGCMHNLYPPMHMFQGQDEDTDGALQLDEVPPRPIGHAGGVHN